MHISLELSQATWLVTALIPGVDKMSKHTTPGGDGVALIELLDRLRAKIDARSPRSVRVIAIEEAGLDGFWVHRLLEANGVESHVVDAASIAVPRRRLDRRATAPPSRENGLDRRRDFASNIVGVAKGRTSCLRYGRPADA